MKKSLLILCFIVTMLMLSSCGQKQVQSSTSEPSDSEESSSGYWEVTVTDSVKQETKRPFSSFDVNKTVFENEYAVIELKAIRTDGIEITAESRLKNRVQSVLIDCISLDGLCVNAYCYDDDSLKPGEKKDLFLQGEINNPEHHVISITGGLYDDSGEEFADIDIIDFDLGGNQNEEYSINTSFSEYKSQHIDVGYVGIDTDGIKVSVKNKNGYKLNLVCDQLMLNGEESGDYYSGITIPGHSTRIYIMDVFNGKPDLIPEEIQSFVGSLYTWGPDGIREEEFTIASDEDLLPMKEEPTVSNNYDNTNTTQTIDNRTENEYEKYIQYLGKSYKELSSDFKHEEAFTDVWFATARTEDGEISCVYSSKDSEGLKAGEINIVSFKPFYTVLTEDMVKEELEKLIKIYGSDYKEAEHSHGEEGDTYYYLPDGFKEKDYFWTDSNVRFWYKFKDGEYKDLTIRWNL